MSLAATLQPSGSRYHCPEPFGDSTATTWIVEPGKSAPESSGGPMPVRIDGSTVRGGGRG